ncbi:MAG: hypothetical protein H6R18_2748 [Proteobacteria bacterium]|nr:hypothetical protein [Pseudomonadota bacterium]
MFSGGFSRRLAALLGAAFCILAAACSSFSEDFGRGPQQVRAWAAERGFVSLDLVLSSFSLLALVRGQAGGAWTVYIEGDGAAWPTPYHPPVDPTPSDPLALRLAVQDVTSNVVYLGRPCQYLSSAALADCPARFWLGHRFSPQVLSAYQEWLDRFKRQYGVREFRLIVYSGGGVLASLLAGQREDVVQLVTVASPLDISAWVRHHDLSPLKDSLDPVQYLSRLPPRSTHLVGGADDIVPAHVVQGAMDRLGGEVRVIKGYDHVCCWSRDWRKFLGELR